ncbi:MAG: MarR family transcriptional regulator [Thermodesulfobacteriota bacterium]
MSRKRGKGEGRASESSEDMLASFHRLSEAAIEFSDAVKEAAAKVHSKGELTDATRAVLMAVSRGGPQTVPHIARRLKFSRQHILTITDTLVADSLLEAVDNPDHKRSMLLRLTGAGIERVSEMNRTEAEIMSRLPLEVTSAEMERARECVSSLTEIFKSKKWEEILTEYNL